jgi:hypothetical protein
VDAHTFTKHSLKTFAGSCFLGHEGVADGRIHAKRGYNNVTSILQTTREIVKGQPFRTKGVGY